MRSDARLLASGMRYYRGGRLRQAEHACREVLRSSPEHPDALHLLARVAADSGRPDLAAALVARAIQRRGATAPLCITLGLALRAAGDRVAAAACVRQAVALDPASAAAHFEHGQALMLESRVDEAAASFAAALRLDPGHAPALARLANVLEILGRPEDALAGYDAALRLDSHEPLALLHRSRVLVRLDRLEEAELAYAAALPHWPRSPEAHTEFGAVLRALGRVDAARSSYSAALALNPAFADARWNLALLDLLAGRFAEGWDAYEWRFRRDVPPPPDPLWDGGPLDGRQILLHTEQGFGDAIQFVRYAPLLQQSGAGAVAVACRPELRALFARAKGVTEINPEPSSRRFLNAALMSLPRLFGTTIATVPRAVPYLAADLARTAEWRARLGPSVPGRRRVGVVWAGSPAHENDRRRSIPPAGLRILESVPGVDWFSLQKSAADVPPPLLPLPRELEDFADTAALLMCLDLVVSVDTAVAHLAGALARPVWTLLPFAPDWRWLLHRDDSPWYPTMRLFRQPARNDWPSVLAAVVAHASAGGP